MTILKLTDEMRRALGENDGGPVPVFDDLTGAKYVLVSQSEYLRRQDNHLHEALQVSIDQVARGEVSELNMEEILTEAHRRYDARKS